MTILWQSYDAYAINLPMTMFDQKWIWIDVWKDEQRVLEKAPCVPVLMIKTLQCCIASTIYEHSVLRSLRCALLSRRIETLQRKNMASKLWLVELTETNLWFLSWKVEKSIQFCQSLAIAIDIHRFCISLPGALSASGVAWHGAISFTSSVIPSCLGFAFSFQQVLDEDSKPL